MFKLAPSLIARMMRRNVLPVHQDAKTPGIWNPLPYFDTVKQDGQLQNITDVTNFYKDAKNGTLPL